MKYMQAKFKGTCASTGKAIRKGDEIAYDIGSRKAYLKGNEPKVSDEERMFQDMQNEAADNWYREAHGGY